MRVILLSALALVGMGLSVEAQTAKLYKNQTFQITDPPACPGGHTCGYQMVTGGIGTVTSGGLYTAPANPPRHGFIAGCPVLPGNSIYNVPIDTMPVDPSSSTWIHMLNYSVTEIISGVTRVFPTFTYGNRGLDSNGVAVSDSTSVLAPYFTLPGQNPTPSTNATPVYNAKGMDGFGYSNFRFVTPPMFGFGSRDNPLARVQDSWGVHGVELAATNPPTTSPAGGTDNHYQGVNKDTCEMNELIEAMSPSDLPFPWEVGPCADCNVQALSHYDNGTFLGAESTGKVVAMGTPLIPMQLSQEELAYAVDHDAAGTAMVKHAIAVTFNNSAINGHIVKWPATSLGIGGFSDVVPYGSRLRLKSTFYICGDPDTPGGSNTYPNCYDASRETANSRTQEYMKALLRTFKHYGVHVMDGTTPSTAWGIHIRTTRYMDPDFYSLYFLIGRFGGSTQLNNRQLVDQFEVIDQSGLQVDPLLTLVRNSVAQPASVCYADTTAGGTCLKYWDFAVMPPAIGGFQKLVNVVAGTPAIDLKTVTDTFATGLTNNTDLTWSILSGPGTINATTGFYTPPAAVSNTTATSTYVRVAATEDPTNVFWDMRVVNYPAVGTGLFITAGGTSNINDVAHSKTWWAIDTSSVTLQPFGIPAAVITGKSPNTANWPNAAFSWGFTNEASQDIMLPNGNYTVSFFINTSNVLSATGAYGKAQNQVEVNGVTLRQDDFQTVAGWSTPSNTFAGVVVAQLPVTVSNGKLIYAWRKVNLGSASLVTAIAIEPGPGSAFHLGGKLKFGGGRTKAQRP